MQMSVISELTASTIKSEMGKPKVWFHATRRKLDAIVTKAIQIR